MNNNKKEKKLFLLFSHHPTADQLSDARASFGVESIFEMPGALKEIWKQIPPDTDAIEPLLRPVKKWLIENSSQGDIALIQGDFGAAWLLVKFAMGLGILPVYSTTTREASEIQLPDGSVRIEHLFRHCRFRVYGN